MLLNNPSQIQKPDSYLKLFGHDKQFDSKGPSQVKQVSWQVTNSQACTPTSIN